MASDNLDYDALGFKCGIEIHQQLDTETKLFCNCANHQVDEEADAQVTRQLRPVASELGEVDRAAKQEFLKGTDFVYNIYDDVSCLVELDEEPPHPVSEDALETALEAAKLMDCTVPDEIHFMRKTVIDGSNTAGFQRTAIVGMHGHIETAHGTVAIEDMELEEESAGIHERTGDRAVFDLDRLGIPLIEIGTDASIQTPEHAKEVAEKIGMLLRSTGKVKRGLGTIRQDVNVSIDDGARVEIKGFQDLELLDELVANEVERQRSLIALQDAIDVDQVSGDITDVTAEFADADNAIIDQILAEDGAVVAFTLHGLEGVMNEVLCGDQTLGSELADYAKSQGVNGLMHTDEDISKYDLEDEFAAVCDRLGKEDGDVVAIIAAQDEETAWNAAETVTERADLLPDTVPEETRTTTIDTTTQYARPLPGKARMYPETDIPPITVTDEELAAIETPETLEEKQERYEETVGAELATQLIRSNRTGLYEYAVNEIGLDAETAANIVTHTLGDLESRHDIDPDTIPDEELHAVLEAVEAGDIGKGQVNDVLREAVENDRAAADVIAEMGGTDEDEIRSVVQDVIAEKQDLIAEQGEHAQGALMGVVMQRLEHADGSAVSRILAEELADATE